MNGYSNRIVWISGDNANLGRQCLNGLKIESAEYPNLCPHVQFI